MADAFCLGWPEEIVLMPPFMLKAVARGLMQTCDERVIAMLAQSMSPAVKHFATLTVTWRAATGGGVGDAVTATAVVVVESLPGAGVRTAL